LVEMAFFLRWNRTLVVCRMPGHRWHCCTTPASTLSSLTSENSPSRFICSNRRHFSDQLSRAPEGAQPSGGGGGGGDGEVQGGGKHQPSTDKYLHERYKGISVEPFPQSVQEKLSAAIDHDDVEIRPEGNLYLPSHKYRKVLNSAFGIGGWGLVPLGELQIENKEVTREYALYCWGRYISQATGHAPTHLSLNSATEGAKASALVRCCKDLGIGSHLWDLTYGIEWKKNYTIQVWCQNQKTGEKRLLFRKKSRPAFSYPWKEDHLPTETLEQMCTTTTKSPFLSGTSSNITHITPKTTPTTTPARSFHMHQHFKSQLIC